MAVETQLKGKCVSVFPLIGLFSLVFSRIVCIEEPTSWEIKT